MVCRIQQKRNGGSFKNRGRSEKKINDTSFADITDDEKSRTQLLRAIRSCDEINKSETEICYVENEVYYSLLAQINGDPISYREAIESKERELWQAAINDELHSLDKNKVWTLVQKPESDAKSLNIIKSRWVFKRKFESDKNIKYKATLVIKGFMDKNNYDLEETYAPVSRFSLVRAVFAIINKYDLDVCELDVKSAFLNGLIYENIYMEIPEGVNVSESERKNKICKLERALCGLRISSKKWNIRFTDVPLKVGLKNDKTEPCLFTWSDGLKFLILLLYVDDIILASNDNNKLLEVKAKLKAEFEMSDLGEPKEFLGISITRNREKQEIVLNQEKYINKVLARFNFTEAHPQRTLMVTTQVTNRERREY